MWQISNLCSTSYLTFLSCLTLCETVPLFIGSPSLRYCTRGVWFRYIPSRSFQQGLAFYRSERLSGGPSLCFIMVYVNVFEACRKGSYFPWPAEKRLEEVRTANGLVQSIQLLFGPSRDEGFYLLSLTRGSSWVVEINIVVELQLSDLISCSEFIQTLAHYTVLKYASTSD